MNVSVICYKTLLTFILFLPICESMLATEFEFEVLVHLPRFRDAVKIKFVDLIDDVNSNVSLVVAVTSESDLLGVNI